MHVAIRGRVENRRVVLGAASLMILAMPLLVAQVTMQEIPLRPGWNAVYLEVTPEDRSCDAVFRGMPIASVWRWNPNTDTVQFIQDPSSLLPEDPDWLVYFPPTSDENVLSTLHAIHGGRPYLIQLRGNLPAVLRVKGQPVLPSVEWRPDSFNFVGFPISPVEGPTFQSFFAASAAHAGQQQYTLNVQGAWELIADPATARLASGHAYWIFCKGASEYQGPSAVAVDQGGMLNFSDVLVESHLHLVNGDTSQKTFTLTLEESEAPTSDALPVRAGAVALSYWKDDYAQEEVGWRPLDGPLSLTVAAGARYSLRLAVRRSDFPAYTPAAPDEVFSYQSLLAVDNGAGQRVDVPVSAFGLQATADKSGVGHPRAGLWVGAVTLNQVTEHVPNLVSDGPKPTASEFQFKLIVHVDGQGTPRLLRQVTQMWRKGAYMADPQVPGRQVVSQPGEYVLFTDMAKMETYLNEDKIQGAVLRDGVPAGRRISTSIFGFDAPQALSGAFPTPQSPTSQVTANITLDFDDPLNPFKHKYHPDHNNLREDYATMLDEGKESWTVVRHLTFDFTATDPEFPEGAQSGWGDTQLGGVYTEVLEGLHRDAITTKGVFRLHRVSNVDELDPDL